MKKIPFTAPKGLPKTMPTKEPMKSNFTAPDLSKRAQVQSVRPTSMRNLGPWKGNK